MPAIFCTSALGTPPWVKHPLLSVAGFLIRLLVSYHRAPRVLPHPGAVCAAHVVAVTPRGPSPFRITHLVSQSNLPSWMAFWGSAPRTLPWTPNTPISLQDFLLHLAWKPAGGPPWAASVPGARSWPRLFFIGCSFAETARPPRGCPSRRDARRGVSLGSLADPTSNSYTFIQPGPPDPMLCPHLAGPL